MLYESEPPTRDDSPKLFFDMEPPVFRELVADLGPHEFMYFPRTTDTAAPAIPLDSHGAGTVHVPAPAGAEWTIPAGAGGFLASIADHIATTTGANEHQDDEPEPDFTDYCNPQCGECPHCTGCGGSARRDGPYGCTCDELGYDCGNCHDEGCERCEDE